ncbi:MAG: peptide chain release factor 1 [Chthoniobacterales bacterium]
MDFAPLIEKKRLQFHELEAAVASANFFQDAAKAREKMRDHSRLKTLLENWELLQKSQREIVENQDLAKSHDPEMAEMAALEIPELEKRIHKLERDIQIAILPPETGEDRDAIFEIRAGTGGDEAALFAADLYRMYCRYAEAMGLKTELMESSPSGLGGFKDVIFKLSGEGSFRISRYESGVHRVQRVPTTEAQGRIHTSTATVAVLPEAEEVDFELRPQDLRIEVCRSGGPGGQGVNTTDSAVQIMHIPTGKIVRCQDGRSQQKNKEKALTILRTRLLEEKQREEHEKYSAHRKSLIGSGGREEKIRTYNFPQNRITDHRIGLTLRSLDRFIEGDMKEMLDALQDSDLQQRLAEANLG